MIQRLLKFSSNVLTIATVCRQSNLYLLQLVACLS